MSDYDIIIFAVIIIIVRLIPILLGKGFLHRYSYDSGWYFLFARHFFEKRNFGKNFALGMAVSYCFAVLVKCWNHHILACQKRKNCHHPRANWASDFARPKVHYCHRTNGHENQFDQSSDFALVLVPIVSVPHAISTLLS